MTSRGAVLTSHRSHLVGVASEQMDILLDPVQSQSLVQEPSIGYPSRILERRASEPAQSAQSVPHGYKHDTIAPVFLARGYQAGGVTAVFVDFIPPDISATVKPGAQTSAYRSEPSSCRESYQTTTGAPWAG